MYTRLSSLVCLLTLLAVVGCNSSTPAPQTSSPEDQKKIMEAMLPNVTPEIKEQVKSASSEATPAASAEEKPAEEKKE